MKCLQYQVSKFALKTLDILSSHPGLQASEFAAFCWPHVRKGGLLAAINLHHLVKQRLIRARFEPSIFKRGPVKPRKRYYVADKGFSVHEFYTRQRRAGHTG